MRRTLAELQGASPCPERLGFQPSPNIICGGSRPSLPCTLPSQGLPGCGGEGRAPENDGKCSRLGSPVLREPLARGRKPMGLGEAQPEAGKQSQTGPVREKAQVGAA